MKKMFIIWIFLFCGFLLLSAQSPGDVNRDQNITIVDALMVAQYYVGLLGVFTCGSTPTPGFTPTPVATGTARDVFGISMMYPTLTGSLGWDSRHWDNGINRTLSNDIMSGNDPEDPTFWSEYRGSGVLIIDANGILTMGGSQPRIYINSYPGIEEINPDMFF